MYKKEKKQKKQRETKRRRPKLIVKIDKDKELENLLESNISLDKPKKLRKKLKK